MNITILHSNPPDDAIRLSITPLPTQTTAGMTLHIDVVDMHDPDERAELLTQLQKLSCAVVLYTGIPTSDADAPCGCYGYSDYVCDYHRQREYSVAECWCSEIFGTQCEYHRFVHDLVEGPLGQSKASP